MDEKKAVFVRNMQEGLLLPYSLELIRDLFDRGVNYAIVFSDGSTSWVNWQTKSGGLPCSSGSLVNRVPAL